MELKLVIFFLKKNEYKNKNIKSYKDNNEQLIQYIKFTLKQKHYDYFIFGHRHIPMKVILSKSIYFNLGDWVKHFTYLEYRSKKFQLKKWKFKNII